MSNKWVDVGTTIIPRSLTEKGIGSFMDCMDHTGYRLRWVVHLDSVPGLEHHWDENVRQIEQLSHRFDEVVVMKSHENQGYGVAVHKVMSELNYDTLWIEDDWQWRYTFKLADVKANAQDGFYFWRPHVRMGNTGPSFWRFYVIEYLLSHWPENPSELAFKRVLRGVFRNNNKHIGIPKRTCLDIGREVMANEGFDRNLQGKDLSPYRTQEANRTVDGQ